MVVLGMHAQASSNEQPVEVGASDQANGNPALRDTRDKDRPWQAHQQPAAHIRSTGRQGRDETTETAPAKNVIGEVFGCPIGGKADQHHSQDVDHEGDQHGSCCSHSRCPFRLFLFRTGTNPRPVARTQRLEAMPRARLRLTMQEASYGKTGGNLIDPHPFSITRLPATAVRHYRPPPWYSPRWCARWRSATGSWAHQPWVRCRISHSHQRAVPPPRRRSGYG